MTKEELINFLKESLEIKIDMKSDSDYYSRLQYVDITVTLMLGEEIIHSASDSLTI